MGKTIPRTLLIIGGAEDKDGKREILNWFVKISGGNKAAIVIVATATQDPVGVGQEYYNIFKNLGAGEVKVLNLQSRQQANQVEAARIIENATGIFFTGGDQLRITTTLGGTASNRALRKAFNNGVVLAGTSAGASCMSNIMIVEGDSEEAPKLNTIKLAPGLGLIEEVVIDQHFAQRGRIGRLLSAVAYNPYILGIGIDEDTAILVGSDNKLEVIGSQTVTFIDGRNIGFTNVSEMSTQQALAIDNVVMHILPKGFGFDLVERSTFVVNKEEDNNED